MEDPGDEPERDDHEQEESPDQQAHGQRKRIPDPDPEAREKGKRYLVRDGNPPLAVTISAGPVTDSYAPAELVVKLADRITSLLKEMGGGVPPMLYRITATNSMQLVFGDADPDDVLPLDATAVHAERVADLIAVDDEEELFARALTIGAPVRFYNDITQLVQSENIVLRWAARYRPEVTLNPVRAERQHFRLSAPPETVDRELNVNGILYRVITEPTGGSPEGTLGTIGIHLHSWSARLPHDPSRKRIIAAYVTDEVREAIKTGLVGEPVSAKLTLRQPIAGRSLVLQALQPVLSSIGRGPPEELQGPGMFDEDDEDDT